MSFFALVVALVLSYLLPLPQQNSAPLLLRSIARWLRQVVQPFRSSDTVRTSLSGAPLTAIENDASPAVGEQTQQRMLASARTDERWFGLGAFIAMILIVLIPAALIFSAAHHLGSIAEWLVLTAILYVLLGFWRSASNLNERALQEHKREGREPRDYAEKNILGRDVARELERAHRRGFALLFWFAIIPGPFGALIYWITSELADLWCDNKPVPEHAFGEAVWLSFYVLDWLPQRVSAISFAAVGNFEDAYYCWKTQARERYTGSIQRVVAAAAGAVGVRLGGFELAETADHLDTEVQSMKGIGEPQQTTNATSPLGMGDPIDAAGIEAIEAMLWRAIGLWLTLSLLITLARAY